MRTPLMLLLLLLTPLPALAVPYDEPPINYSATPPNDPVARLQHRMERGDVKLSFDPKHGYMPSLLKELGISPSSQVLVFSKTSFQSRLISPQSPRALYFNDNTYVGWVHHGDVLELASQDPRQGTQFYTLKQKEEASPRIVRQTDACLQCHDSERSQGVPGVLVRSVFPSREGQPVLSAGTFVTNWQSPLRERWGGWYVTGQHGSMRHMGNSFVDDPDKPDAFSRDAGANITSLAKYFDTTRYMRPTSDIVALMVLEHQTQMHDLLTRAAFETRIALRDQEEMNKALNESPDYRSPGTQSRIKNSAERVVKALLFSGEATLDSEIVESNDYRAQFESLGPKDGSGRSLRDFDLKRRLFKFPLSFLIYSESFDALPPDLKATIYDRLLEVLSGKDTSKDFSHLSSDDRASILEILRATKQDLPQGFAAK